MAARLEQVLFYLIALSHLQGDQIWRIFAQLGIVYFVLQLKDTEIDHFCGLLFPRLGFCNM
jgi:hypothetical protein